MSDQDTTISLYLFDYCREEGLSRCLDKMSFKIFIAGFTGVNVVLLAVAVF